MADPISGLDMVREIIGQINNLRKLITIGGKQYRLDEKTRTYKADGKTFTRAQLRAKLEGQSYTAPKLDKKSKLKINKKKSKAKQTKTTGGKIPDPWKDSYKTPKSDNLKIKEKIRKLTNKAKNTKDSIPTPKTTPKKTKTKKTKGFKQKTQYKTTGKPPVQIKPKKLIKQGGKILKKIKKIPGAGMVGRGAARLSGIAGGIGMGSELTKDLVDHARGVTNLVQRARKKPYKTFGATGYEKKIIEQEEAKYRGDKLKVKKTNNKKTTTTSKKTTPSNTSPKANEIAQVKQNIKKAKGWNKRKLEREQAYLEKFGKQPRTWKNPEGQVSRKPSEGDFKSSSKSSGKKMHAIEKRNREIHGDDRIEAVKKYHAGWKKARKEGRLEEWKKKNKARRGWQ